MRWERLFAELEAQVNDVEMQERDALVDELADGDWASTSWRDLLGGRVVLDVHGHGWLDGEVVLVNQRFVQLRGERVDHLVNATAVLAIVSAERRAVEASRVSAGLGWGHVFRALREDPVRVRKIDGSTVDGSVDVVGGDFVRMRDESGRHQVLPFDAIAVVSGLT
jgi:PAS domain-containing protein